MCMYQAFAFVHLLVIYGISCSIPKKCIYFLEIISSICSSSNQHNY